VVVPSDASTNFTIGVNNDGNSPWNFGGSMYNVRFWNKTLTQTEIQSNMSNTVAPQAGLVVNFSCNQGVANGNNSSISQLIDASGNGFNGVLNNFNKNGSNSNFVTGPSASSITLTNSFNGTSNASGTYPLGITNITWTATDAAGNTSTASQTVTVVDATAPTINTVANINTIATSAAGAVVNYSAPVGTDNCSGSTTTQTAGLPSGSTFPIGTTTNTFVVTDAAGLKATSSFTVTVTGLAPSIVVPSTITVNAPANACEVAVNFAATDTTAIPASTISYSHQPGSLFPVGTTIVTATATNAIGTSVKTFEVIAKDVTAPTIAATANINAIATSAAGAVVNYIIPAAS
ncbi:MAG: HYR domain-containing protein, partial [Dolichospermum sp.]